MRELLYVPVIHGEADLGSLGAALDRRSAARFGEKRWAQHKETLARFWESVEAHLLSLDAASLKVYQDGLPAGGQLGRQLVEEAAKRGSANHQVVLRLMARGAEVRKTEDPSLLAQELRVAREESTGGTVARLRQLSLTKARLTEERDRYIARTIDETLRQGEKGVLFIGAYHNAHLYLAADIAVQQLKEQDKVKAYFEELVSGRGGERLRQLARYLTSPVPPWGTGQ